MTPLAKLILESLIRIPRKWIPLSTGDRILARKLRGAHYFEVSAAQSLAHDLARKIASGRMQVGVLGFLPADKTWIEYQVSHGQTIGVLIEAFPDGSRAAITQAYQNLEFGYSSYLVDEELILSCDGSEPGWVADSQEPHWPPFIFAVLALINSPRVIGRVQHMPNGARERHLIARKRLIGKFPVGAWTEINLKITAPDDLSGNPSSEAHYTGEKALHFCRKHLRVRFGRLEIVSAHWRGNAAIGIKRSRYRLMPPDKHP